MILPRQARDKHRENSKNDRFLAGGAAPQEPRRCRAQQVQQRRFCAPFKFKLNAEALPSQARDNFRKKLIRVRFCRQKRSTIEIEADPSTGRFVQHQVPITPLPLLIAKKDGEREGLLEELIDEMGEMQKHETKRNETLGF
eukprot:COSAG06_NODE_254_length_19039_cov_5.465488_2_plen_141_part_00